MNLSAEVEAVPASEVPIRSDKRLIVRDGPRDCRFMSGVLKVSGKPRRYQLNFTTPGKNGVFARRAGGVSLVRVPSVAEEDDHRLRLTAERVQP